MSERKVINKYYPPDFDPSKVPRMKKKDKPNVVRTMAPVNMKCKTCGNYIARATKFNAKKTTEPETYNGVKIYRLHIKCPRCMAAISYKTDPKTGDYVVDEGAIEEFMALKMAERQALEEAEVEKEMEKIDPMKQLENRTKASRQQMEASEQIQTIRAMKQKMHSVDIDALIKRKQHETIEVCQPDAIETDSEIRAETMKILKRKAEESSSKKGTTSFEPSAKKSANTSVTKLSSSLMDLKNRIKIKSKTKDGNSSKE